MIASTNDRGIKFQTDRKLKAQEITWEDLPRVIALLQNIARQRVQDLEIAAKQGKSEIAALKAVA